MFIEMNVNIEDSIVKMLQRNDNGTMTRKEVSLNDFLENYTSLIKEREDKYNFLFFPPGTVEYIKKLNTVTYIIHTNQYREFYGLDSEDSDYLMIMSMDVDCTKVIGVGIYETKGSFNKYISRFSKVFETEDAFGVDDETSGALKCLEMITKDKDRVKLLSVKSKYSDILK